MFALKPYQRLHAVEYAKKWALDRNPLFQDFAECGGDCTNYISQCIFAGSCIMNDTPTFGWFFRSPGDYAPAWTGVPYLYNFLISNMGNGPVGVEVPRERIELGDIIQLGRRDGTFYHTVIITAMRDDEIFVCAHNNDALNRPLSTYSFEAVRYIHITGVRFTVSAGDCCFDTVIDGTAIFPTEAQASALSCEINAEPAVPTPLPADIPPKSSAEQQMPSGISDAAQRISNTQDNASANPEPPTDQNLPNEPKRPADILPTQENGKPTDNGANETNNADLSEDQC